MRRRSRNRRPKVSDIFESTDSEKLRFSSPIEEVRIDLKSLPVTEPSTSNIPEQLANMKPRNKPLAFKKKLPIDFVVQAASSVDVSKLENQENMTDFFDMPFGCRWDKEMEKEDSDYEYDALPSPVRTPPPSTRQPMGVKQAPPPLQPRPMSAKQVPPPVPRQPMSRPVIPTVFSPAPISAQLPIGAIYPQPIRAVGPAHQPIRMRAFVPPPPGFEELGKNSWAGWIRNVQKADQQSQTELDLESELFELIVFDIDLLELVEDRMPQILDIICKLVISPTAVLQDAIIDPRSAQCDGDFANKATQTAESPDKFLVTELLSNPAIFESIRLKNEALATKLRRMYKK